MDIVRIIPVNKSELLLYNKKCGRCGSCVMTLDRKHLDAMYEMSTDIHLRDVPFSSNTETLTITKDANGKYIVKDNENLGLLDSTDEYTTLYLLYKHNMYGFIKLEDDDISNYYGTHSYEISNIGGEYAVNVGNMYISLFSLIYYIIDKKDTSNKYGMYTNEITADEILHGNIPVSNYFDAYSELCNRYKRLNSKKEYAYCIGEKYKFKLNSLKVSCDHREQSGNDKTWSIVCETYTDDSMNNIIFISKKIKDSSASIAMCIKNCMNILSYRDYWNIKNALGEGNKIIGISIDSNNKYKYIIDNFNKNTSNIDEINILSKLTNTSDCEHKQVEIWVS